MSTSTASELRIPGLGESITEATIAKWVKASGDSVGPDDVVAELETDKATVEIAAGGSGVLRIVKEKGQTVVVGDLIANIEPAGAASGAPVAQPSGKPQQQSTSPATAAAAPKAGEPVPATPGAGEPGQDSAATGPLSPAVERLIKENQLNAGAIAGSGPKNRLTKGDVLAFIEQHGSPGQQGATMPQAQPPQPRPDTAPPVPANGAPRTPAGPTADGEETRVEMSKLRETIARRLVEAQHTAAILTTFNEIDMAPVMALREKYKERFEKQHKIGLGFLSFFAKAAVAAMQAVPAVNGQIQGRTMVYKKNLHLGVAVSTEKGLVVPVVRYANRLSMAQIEAEIKRLAGRAREGKITVDELGGGTFTITNGGVFGSLLSTPILNPPQSAILGLHKIEKRTVVVDDQIVIRPMMYVALSYDHRIIDGQQAVTFLVRIKEALEDPARMLLDI